MGMWSGLHYLIFEVIIVFLQLTVITCNGFVLFLFIREKNLRQNSSRHLVLLLATTDFIHALATLPYTTYLISSWNPVYIDLSPYYVMVASTPMIAQLKINLTLTMSIAVDRTLALSFPVLFRKLSYHSYAKFCLLFGFALAAFDLILEFSLSSFKRAPDCLSIGCFLSAKFRYYWGISNMVMGITVFVLTSFILMKLRAINKQPQPVTVALKSKENRFKQANRNCAAILFTSLVFVTIPSVGAGLIEMLGFQVFKAVGSFYILGLLCAGVCNCAINLALNKEMQIAARNCITGKAVMSVSTVSSSRVFSIVRR